MPRLRHIALMALLALAACAEPTTINPGYSPAELQHERQAQEAAVRQARTADAQGDAHAVAAFDSSKPHSAEAIAPLQARLAPLAQRVEQAAAGLCRDMRGAQAECRYQVILDAKETGLNAHADGQNVVINPAMVEFASNDTHLAFVISHEFAHNIMGHIEAQKQNVSLGNILGSLGDALAQTQGVNTQGTLGKIGASQALLHYSPNFEAEADYVGLYILARAEFPIEQAPDFWRLMSVNQPDTLYVTSTHPNNPSRTLAMEKTIVEIRNKQANHQPLLPNIRPQA